MVFKNIINRIITSFILMFIFGLVFLFYDVYLKVLTYLIYLFVFLELILFFRKNIYIFVISIFYLFISLICFASYFSNYYIKEEFVYTISIVIVFDIFSYFFGKKFGKLKMLPTISPNKTYFGFITGFITAFILGALSNYYFNFFDTGVMIIFITFTLIIAFLGDIIESFFKRKSNLVNSSKLLPGHGGFFDRFDSLIMVFMWLFLFNLII